MLQSAEIHLRPPQARDMESYISSGYKSKWDTSLPPSHWEQASPGAWAHLRHPLGRDKAGGLDNGEPCFGKHVYQLDFHWGGDNTL